MHAENLPQAYLSALQAADVDAVLALFAEHGRVHSPLYGVLPAAEFYPQLFGVSERAILTLRASMAGRTDDDRTVVSFWFHFDWRLTSGEDAPFTVVDVAELDAAGRITDLHIVYDTADVRPQFERAAALARV